MSARKLYSWGDNSNNGQLGLEDILNRSSPEQVGSLINWGYINCGDYNTAAIKTDGTLWTWGDNDYGQLGLEDIIDRSSPEQVGSLTDWSDAVTCGSNHTAAIKTDGTLWAWGDNSDNGQLGLEDIIDRSSPVQVGLLTDWSYVDGGAFYTTAIKTDGTLWTWGDNNNGQLGQEDQDDRSSPEQVGSLTNWSSVGCGFYHTTAIKTDGTLWTWGRNNNGQLGQEDVLTRSSPEQVGALTNWSFVACGGYYTTAIKTDGTLWSWGENFWGTLGLGDSGSATYRSSPEQVGSLTDWRFINNGQYHNTAIKTDGTLWTWGDNSSNGQLGLEDIIDRSSPVQVGALTNWSSVAGGSYHTLGIQADKSIVEDISLDAAQGSVCWGHATYSDIEEDLARPLGAWAGDSELVGTGDEETLEMEIGEYEESETWEVGEGPCGIDLNKYRTGSQLKPTIKYKTDATEAGCEIDTALWTWGENGNGALGLEDEARRSSPEQVGSLPNWDFVAGGGYRHTIAIKTDGTLWSWGNNVQGNLGLEDTAHRSSPEQVGGLTDWSSGNCGSYHSTAIKTDGTLWSWGNDAYGKLGHGDVPGTHKSSPEQVGTLANWSYVDGGIYHTVAVKTYGTLWGWGRNEYGQLGLGDQHVTDTDRSSPEQVGTLTNWSFVFSGGYHTAAIKTDGTLWTWGDNSNNGQLGLEDIADRSSPVQVGLLTDWSYVDGGAFYTTAIKTDGTLWTWGDNSGGQLGLEDIADRSSPEQVGSLTDWDSVACGLYHTIAIKTDGTIWAWGDNTNFGQLGLEDEDDRSSPEQVGALTTWSSVTAGGYNTTVVKNRWLDYNGVSFESQGWVKVRLER